MTKAKPDIVLFLKDKILWEGSRLLMAATRTKRKPHAWVEVYPNRLEANFKVVRRLVGAKAKIFPAVKANGYGHGIVEAAQAFQKGGADGFGVAWIDEAILLRRAGIKKPVLLLGGLHQQEIGDTIEFDITPSLADLAVAEKLNREAQKRGIRKSVHLNMDTGMGRSGVPVQDAEAFLKGLGAFTHLHLQGIFTHLAASEESDGTSTRAQLGIFRNALLCAEKLGLRFPLVHTANSGGVLYSPASRFNMVRPGIMLYGYLPAPNRKRPRGLKPALAVKSQITLVKRVVPGTPLGYNHTYIAKSAQTIATLPIGYGDGYRRAFSNCAKVLVNGVACPVRGRVSMDQILVDVSRVSRVRLGDVATVISPELNAPNSVDRLAKLARTISYEITCALGPRLPRVYSRK